VSKKLYGVSVEYGFVNEDSVFGFFGCSSEGVSDDGDNGPVEEATINDPEWFRRYMRAAMAMEPYLDKIPFDELAIVEKRSVDEWGLNVRFELTHPRDLPTAAAEGPTVAFDFSFSHDPEWTEEDLREAQEKDAQRHR
jgi:hypothetical protein